MNNDELENFVFTKILHIFNKLTNTEQEDILTVTFEAYQNGYKQALIDAEKSKLNIEIYDN